VLSLQFFESSRDLSTMADSFQAETSTTVSRKGPTGEVGQSRQNGPLADAFWIFRR
jgi:hypothetical protein